MATSTNTEAGVITRSELPTSPDAGLTETLNLSATDVAEFIKSADDDSLEFIQERAEHALSERTPEHRGALEFDRIYFRKKREYRSAVDGADELLSEAEGAVEAFFHRRGASVVFASPDFVLTPTHMVGRSQMKVRDRRLGRLKVAFTACYSDAAADPRSAVSVNITRWGRAIATFDGDSPAECIGEFAHWAAQQPR